jgi:glycine dehydrogenase
MPDTPAFARPTLHDLEDHGAFARRHIGPTEADQAAMLATLGYTSRSALIDAVIPTAIRARDGMDLGPARGEEEALARIRAIAARNRVFRSHIGQGYYGTFIPTVIRRNIFENPAWYTAYTPWRRCSTSRRWWPTSRRWTSRMRRCSTRRAPRPKR